MSNLYHPPSQIHLQLKLKNLFNDIDLLSFFTIYYLAGNAQVFNLSLKVYMPYKSTLAQGYLIIYIKAISCSLQFITCVYFASH